MADFGKRLNRKDPEKKIHPVEIYKDLDRSSEAGPLRAVQEEVLNSWFDNYKARKDVILKLHTGQGKTLIGLLILQSIINQGKGPTLYLCPNLFLVNQTIEQARKFGIRTCVIGADKSLPSEFLKGELILVANIQKLFHGYTKFGLNNQSVNVGGIILDDSHACIDSIKEAFTIRIPRDNDAAKQIFSLFEDDLEKQASGTYADILHLEHMAFLPIPYWSWIEKSNKVTMILAEHRENQFINYQWPLMKNSIVNCQCYISGAFVEISPYVNPIEVFGTFNNAGHRILMSATTMNDSFFIKGLNIKKEAVLEPLTMENEKWSGEKMIIIPYMINESLNRAAIINHYAIPVRGRNYGIVALAPSYKHANDYSALGCTLTNNQTFDSEMQVFKSGNFDKPFIIVNRYDGIDLPDSTCRLLIIDSKPYSESLTDKYEETAREDSDITNIKAAQKIEQGLGRSVRGEKDYCAILVIGGDLVNFIRNPRTLKYFSAQTRRQIDIGFEIAEIVTEDADPHTKDMMKALSELIKQCIVARDDKWKEFYKERMNEANSKCSGIDITGALELERNAESFDISGQYDNAKDLIQKYLDNARLSESENGWYLQMMARFMHKVSPQTSNQLQSVAYQKNKNLLKPREGYSYKKINLINTTRVNNIKKWVGLQIDHEKLNQKVNDICALLSFEETAEHFEAGLQEMGIAIGFESQRPDNDDREGPDNLWALEENDYILFECKNEVFGTREEINKAETGQMNNSCGWFKNNYSGATFKPIMIISTKNISSKASFVLPVEILRKNGLKNLRNNFKAFYNEFKKFQLSNLDPELIQNLLVAYSLDTKSIKTLYAEKPFQR